MAASRHPINVCQPHLALCVDTGRCPTYADDFGPPYPTPRILEGEQRHTQDLDKSVFLAQRPRASHHPAMTPLRRITLAERCSGSRPSPRRTAVDIVAGPRGRMIGLRQSATVGGDGHPGYEPV